jgi:DNA-binding XRE family transcriptional regulator
VIHCPKPTNIPKNPQTWGEHIKKQRFELGLFQSQVAKIIGVTECTISNWEKNYCKPMLWIIPKIIKFLGYKPKLLPTLTLGQRIKSYRCLHGINQEELAHQLDVDPATLGRWERDECKPKRNLKKRLEAFLNVLRLDQSC